MKSVRSIIESKYDSFTDAEKKIAKFYIGNSEKTDFSVKAISEKLYVSNSTLIRFAKKLGYKGYREFIYEYEASFEKENVLKKGGTVAVFTIYEDLLHKSAGLIDEAQIARVIKYMNDAQQVYVLGKGSSGLSASEMEMRFARVGVNMDSLIDSDRMRMQTVFWDSHNLIIGISVSGKSADVLYSLKEAHKRMSKTVLLTTKCDDSLYEFCDEVLLMPNIGHLEKGNLISPQIPVLILIDELYFGFMKTNKSSKENLHNETVWSLSKRK